MKKIKRVLTLLLVVVTLVPTAVYGAEGKFLVTPDDNRTYIKLTNYKGKSPDTPQIIYEMVWNQEAMDNRGEGEEYSPRGYEYEIEDTAVTIGPTTLTVHSENYLDATLSITPVISKMTSDLFEVGETQLYIGKKNIPNMVLKPGEYIIELLIYPSEADDQDLVEKFTGYLKVEDGKGTSPAKQTVTNKNTAKPTSSKVLVNNKAVAFEAYTINNSNYIKLRDFAYAVTGTKKQFEVSWNAERKAVELVSNHSYTATGTELGKGNGKAKTPVLNKSKIYKNGQEVNLTAYTIDGNNYFKLRDLAGAFNIEVTYDSDTATIGINSEQ